MLNGTQKHRLNLHNERGSFDKNFCIMSHTSWSEDNSEESVLSFHCGAQGGDSTVSQADEVSALHTEPHGRPVTVVAEVSLL